MADPYFIFVTAQFRATKLNPVDLNSAIPYGWYARYPINPFGNNPTISNEYTFLNPYSFKFVKPQLIALEKYLDSGIPLDPGRFLSSDFVVEGRFYFLSLTTAATIFDCWTSSNGWKITVNTNGTIQLNEKNLAVSLISLVGGPLVTINTPYHIALTRTGSILRLFLNGVKIAETTLLTAHAWATGAPTFLVIGGQWNTRVTTTDFEGYADDIRITRGVSRYTTDFTPPVASDFTEFSLSSEGSTKYFIVPDLKNISFVKGEKPASNSPQIHSVLSEINDVYIGANTNGDGELYDTITRDDTPTVRKVTLLERESKVVSRITYSDTGGIFHLKGLDKNLNYMLIGEDSISSSPRKNAAIRDFVKCIPKVIISRKPLGVNPNSQSSEYEIRAINFSTPVTVTIDTVNDIGIVPTTVTINPVNKTGYFAVNPNSLGAKTLTFTNNVNSNNPDPLIINAVNPVVLLTKQQPEFYLGEESSELTITLSNFFKSFDVNFTINGIPGTLSIPNNFVLNKSLYTKKFKFTPNAVGPYSFPVANDGGVSGPSELFYFVTTPDQNYTSTGFLLKPLYELTDEVFVDNSNNPKTITNNGVIISPGTNLGRCFRFYGQTSYLDVSYGADIDLIDSDFTMDFGFNVTSSTPRHQCLFDFRGSGSNTLNSWHLTLDTVFGTLSLYQGNTVVLSTDGQTYPFNINVDYEVAIVRTGGLLKIFRNGTMIASANINLLATDPTGFRIGRTMVNDEQFQGMISQVRITKGVVRYTGTSYAIATTVYASK